MQGDVGAKFMVKRLKDQTKFINVNSLRSFKDFDKDQILELNLLKLILKSKRIIKIIKKINGLKKIVLDNQIKCNTPKIEIT